jgi:hypothetical protein
MTFLLPGTPAPKKDPYANADRAYEEAKAARQARRGRDKALSWEKAQKQVRGWTTSMAVEALNAMPTGLQQMYLLAEETQLNRAEVQRFFPAVAPSTREAWAGLASPQEPPKRAPSRGKRSTQ